MRTLHDDQKEVIELSFHKLRLSFDTFTYSPTKCLTLTLRLVIASKKKTETTVKNSAGFFYHQEKSKVK